MRRMLTSLALVALLSGATVTLLAQTESENAAKPAASKATVQDAKVDTATLDAKIEALLKMPAAERRAHLKQMAPAERRGLWLRLKRTELKERSPGKWTAGPGRTGRYKEPGFPVTARPKRANVPNKLIGTIAYDSGFPTIGFGGGAIIGNRFNTHTGIPVLASGTVETVQALVVPGPANTTSSAGFVLLGPQTGGGGAMAIFSTFTGATGVVDSLTFTGIGAGYTGSSYFVLFGDFASVYVPVFGTGTTLGQGHHGVVGYTGGMGPNITGTFDFGGALNSYIRTSGNIVPVELMNFEVE